MIGFRSGKLLVQRFAHSKAKRAYWSCRCDCGKTVSVMGKYLRKFQVKSCGCLNRSPLVPRLKHGHTKGGVTRTYRIWAGMLQRCQNPKSSGFYKYGGRGILVCDQWQSFPAFLSDMGTCPPGLTIERMDNNGPYSKSNCRWATTLEQGANSRRNRWITFNGQRLHLAAWARRLAITSGALHTRIAKHGVAAALSDL